MMLLYTKNFSRKSSKLFTLLAFTCFFISAVHSQVRLAGLAGISYSKNNPVAIVGVLNAGYEFKGISLLYDQRHQVFIGKSWFGANAGYTIRAGERSIRPYAGYWYGVTGTTKSTDRYIQNGTEKILSQNNAVNSWNGGGGLQLFYGKYMIDIGYHGVYSFTIGMGGLLD